MKLSSYQEDIIKEILAGQNSLFINAAAGAAKSTTIQLAANEVFKKGASKASCLFLAFNKHITEELQRKLPTGSWISTLNALGYNMWISHMEKQGFKVEMNPHKMDDIIEGIIEHYQKTDKNTAYNVRACRSVIVQLAALAKSFGVVPQDETTKDLFSVLPDNDITWEVIYDAYDLQSKVEAVIEQRKLYTPIDKLNRLIIDVVRDMLLYSIQEKVKIDFADQIYLPVIHQAQGQYKLKRIYIDEVQDCSAIDHELISLLCKEDTCVYGVGDPLQALYIFRGSLKDSTLAFKNKFGCKEMTLPICYRCGTAIVKEAQKYNPNILPWDESDAGEIITAKKIPTKELREGDAIISRWNAPLVELACNLIAEGVAFQYRGKDVSEDSFSIIRRFNSKCHTTKEFVSQVLHWSEIEESRLKKKQKVIECAKHKDKVKSLLALVKAFEITGGKNLESFVEWIYKNLTQKKGPTLSTIHLMKGFESETVYALDFDRMDVKEDLNALYVGVTRAKKKLIFVPITALKENKAGPDILKMAIIKSLKDPENSWFDDEE